MIATERKAALRCLEQLEQLRIVAAAVSPAIEALVAAAIAATGCSRPQALRRVGVPCAVANWAASSRTAIVMGDADTLAVMEATQAALCQSDGPE